MSQTERIFYIARMLKYKRRTTLNDVARKYEISTRQVKRDIEYLRDRLGAPIVWDPSAHSYSYSEEWHGLDFADETTFLTFAFLKSILNQFMYVPVISDETVSLLKDKLGSHYGAIAEKVRYELSDMEQIGGETAYALCEALMHEMVLEMMYTDAKGEKKDRRIVPLRILNYSGKWYCVAFDVRYKAMRTFSLSRMNNIRCVETEKCALPNDDEIERFVGDSYGIFKGFPIGTATLRFHAGAARSVSNQIWHKDQVLTTGQDPLDPEALDLSLPVHDWTELLGRALRCGAQCEVLDPPEFRARWIHEIRELSRIADTANVL